MPHGHLNNHRGMRILEYYRKTGLFYHLLEIHGRFFKFFLCTGIIDMNK